MLGPFQLHDGDRTLLDVGGRRVRALLARLALEPGRAVSADVLITDLWGAERPSGALNALQSLVSRTRRVLVHAPGVELRSQGAGYVLDVPPDDVDAHRFEHATRRGRELLDEDRSEAATETLREALALWRGEPLGDVDAPFAEPQAARLDEVRLAATEARIEADLRLGRHTELVTELDTLTARFPLRERFTALHMRALYATGRQADALGAYEALRARLDAELGVDPSSELQDVHLAVLRRDPTLHPTPPAARARTVPMRVNSFVGRESEIGEVRESLRSSRLVTLFGPGGAGKTRLASEASASVTDLRVVFVELAAVRNGSDVGFAVTSALGVRDTRALDAADGVADRLSQLLAATPTLLIMDNCEHVIDAAATFVAELLAATADVRVVATSREPLAIAGEVLVQVGPLSMPGESGAVADSDAVRLFADRAAAARPGFVLDEQTTADVVEVCRRLDGMPLAIELAAARLRAMSVRQVAERLDDRFRLLTTGHRTSMPRHRTLRAVVEWSWGLLDDAERALARRMSVFTGPVTPDTVAAVCGDGPDAVYVLASLVEKSLVETVESATDMRYRMLETVRAFCGELLDAAGERDEVARAHADHFIELAEEAAPRLHASDQLTWLDRLDAEHDNIMTAVHWAMESEDAARGVRLGAALAWYWSMAGRITDLAERLGRIADIPGEAPPESLAAVRLMHVCFSGREEWREPTRRWTRECAATGAMSRYVYLALLEPMAGAIAGTGESGDSIRRAAEHADPWARASAVLAEAILAEHRGDLAENEKRMGEAAEAFRRIGERWGIAHTIGGLATSRSYRGDVVGAIEALDEAADAVRELRSTDDLVSMLTRIGMEQVRAGELDRARATLLEARRLGASISHHEVFVSCGLAEADRLAGHLGAAWEHLDEAWRTADRTWFAPHQLRFVVRGVFEAQWHLTAGDLDAALDCLRERPRDEEWTSRAATAELLARWFVASGDHETAAYVTGLALALRSALDLGNPEVRQMLADVDAALDPGVADARRDEGSALTPDEAVRELERLLG